MKLCRHYIMFYPDFYVPWRHWFVVEKNRILLFVFSSGKFCLKVTLDHNFVIGSYGPLVSSSFNIGTKNALPLFLQNTHRYTYSLSSFVSFSYTYLHKHKSDSTHTHTHSHSHKHTLSVKYVCFWMWSLLKMTEFSF